MMFFARMIVVVHLALLGCVMEFANSSGAVSAFRRQGQDMIQDRLYTFRLKFSIIVNTILTVVNVPTGREF